MSLATIAAIRAALEEHLAAISPALATAYENVSFTPQTGTPYQRVFLLPAEPDNPTYGPGIYVEQGIFQVTLCYPLAAGPSAAAARAELVRTNFRRGVSLLKDGVTTTIQRTPEIGVSDSDDACYLLPVRIRWYANVVG